ncbi:hypothetical protein AVEN_176143-1, partial [Araneus ventricosus]
RNLVKKLGLKLQKERQPNVSDDNPNEELVAEFLCRTDIVYPIQELCYCENTDQCFKSTQPSAENHTSSVNISLCMFVLVKVFGKRSWKPYVAQVSALDETDINVVFLKQVSILNFIYQENDTGIIQHGDIIKVLPTPIINIAIL